MLTMDDMGHRVVVRHVVGERDGRPLMTDVLGELASLDDASLTVIGNNGPVVVALRHVVAAKRVPPRPERRGRPQ